MKHIQLILKGFMIGVAMLVPGVSGGTMAIILGIYQDMIDAVSDIFKEFKKHFLFLFLLGIGGILGLVLFSGLIQSLLTSYQLEMQYLFIGIIAGGLPTLYKKTVEHQTVKLNHFIWFIVGLGLVFVMLLKPSALLSIANTQSLLNWILLLVAGIIIAVALVLPGISASFMLLVLGIYSFTLEAIQTMNIFYLVPVGLGVIVGTLVSSKIIQYCLARYHVSTYMLILGFVLGSVLTIFPGIPVGIQWLTSIVLLVIGFLFTYMLGKKQLID